MSFLSKNLEACDMFYKSVLYRCINVIFKWLTSKDFTKKKKHEEKFNCICKYCLFYLKNWKLVIFFTSQCSMVNSYKMRVHTLYLRYVKKWYILIVSLTDTCTTRTSMTVYTPITLLIYICYYYRSIR